MINSFKNISKKTAKEVKWWSYAAWSLPFIALAGLAAVNFFGTETIYNNAIVIITVTFIGVSAFWWWWAIYKFKEVFEVFEKTADQLVEVKEHIVETKEIIREDVGDR